MRRTARLKGSPPIRLLELVDSLRVRRTFAGGVIPHGMLRSILEAARLSPSLANTQPWLLQAADSDGMREILLNHVGAPDGTGLKDLFDSGETNLGRKDIERAGAFVFIFGARKVPFWRESSVLAAYQIILAARSVDLEARAYAPGSANVLSEALQAPQDHVLAALVAIGLPGAEEPQHRPVKTLREILIGAPPDAGSPA